MYKQRSKRVGSTKESRRARYERLMERTQLPNIWNRPEGRGKAFAGSKRNKHLKSNQRNTSKADWISQAVHPSNLNDVPDWSLEMHDIRLDHANGSKPEHHKRFANIEDCFPKLHKHDENCSH